MTARYSRRAALQLGGLSAAALTAAACGVQGAAKQQSTAQAESAADKFWKAQKPTGTVTFANWALYIDPDHQTLKDFTAKTGIKVTYDEVATRVWHFESDHKITDFKGTYEEYQAAVVV